MYGSFHGGYVSDSILSSPTPHIHRPLEYPRSRPSSPSLHAHRSTESSSRKTTHPSPISSTGSPASGLGSAPPPINCLLVPLPYFPSPTAQKTVSHFPVTKRLGKHRVCAGGVAVRGSVRAFLLRGDGVGYGGGMGCGSAKRCVIVLGGTRITVYEGLDGWGIDAQRSRMGSAPCEIPLGAWAGLTRRGLMCGARSVVTRCGARCGTRCNALHTAYTSRCLGVICTTQPSAYDPPRINELRTSSDRITAHWNSRARGFIRPIVAVVLRTWQARPVV